MNNMPCRYALLTNILKLAAVLEAQVVIISHKLNLNGGKSEGKLYKYCGIPYGHRWGWEASAADSALWSTNAVIAYAS